jgi:hypothetical protein
MQDSDRLTKGPLDYEVIVAYTGLNGAVMRVGDKISLDENLGSLLCRKGYLKDVTARIADTITERVEDLETTATSHGSRLTIVEASNALKATEADLTLAENRVTTLEGDMTTAQADITAIELVLSDNNLTTSD